MQIVAANYYCLYRIETAIVHISIALIMLCLYAQLIECDVQVSDQPWQDPRHVLHHHHCRPTGRMPSALFTADAKVSHYEQLIC